MKIRTTKKAINNRYATRIYCSYCALQKLLKYESPVAYTTRREGWSADIYEVNPSTVIITGYAPFGSIRAGYDICRKYEAAAEAIYEKYWRNAAQWEQEKAEYKALIAEFVKEVTQQYGKLDELRTEQKG